MAKIKIIVHIIFFRANNAINDHITNPKNAISI